MRNIAILAIVCVVIGLAIIIGSIKERSVAQKTSQAALAVVPHVGRIEVLNGCGITGAAGAIAEHLRNHAFDVKNIGDAPTWNYPFTMVVSRVADQTIARQICEALGTDKLVLMRNSEVMYDVTVIIGPDFPERIN